MSQFIARNFAGALWNVVKGVLMLTGLVTLVAWQMDASGQRASAAGFTARPTLPPALKSVGPAHLASDTLAMADEVSAVSPVQAAEHKRVATFLARKYKVASDATQWIVGAAYAAGKEAGVDPLLILAVMAIESRMNPFAASGMGAQGLMQVIPKYHLDKFEELGGPDAVLNPVANIRVGAMILKDYLARFGGIESGLRAYSGATGDDMGYAAKVLAERDRLKAAAGLLKAVMPVAAPVADEPQPIKTADAGEV
jgi:soluble lytic murein transglycosylase-like protein